MTDSQPTNTVGTEPDVAEPEIDPARESVETDESTIDPAEAVVGAAAPDFVATGLDGERVSFSDFLGEQNVIVAFSRGNW